MIIHDLIILFNSFNLCTNVSKIVTLLAVNFAYKSGGNMLNCNHIYIKRCMSGRSLICLMKFRWSLNSNFFPVGVSKFGSVWSRLLTLKIYLSSFLTLTLLKNDVLHCLVFKNSLSTLEHAVNKGIWEKYPLSVILDPRPAQPEAFLNESRVTFQQS